jgi:putative intracellular protease/amidase
MTRLTPKPCMIREFVGDVRLCRDEGALYDGGRRSYTAATASLRLELSECRHTTTADVSLGWIQHFTVMNRRNFITSTAAIGTAFTGLGTITKLSGAAPAANKDREQTKASIRKLTPPANGKIAVAFAISTDVTLIDFAGPWEVFNNVMLAERGGDMDAQMPFDLFTVSDSTERIHSGALQLVPNFTFENVPPSQIVVVPAQKGSDQLRAWLKDMSKTADLVMSVCTGAFQLAKAGLLKGLPATTHHDFTDKLQSRFPDVAVQRGVRFVDNDRIATAGGLSSGIDLALHVVERYFGHAAAERTAAYMEYQGKGWTV